MNAFADTILVVDDDPDIREILKDRLESMNYRVLVAADGPEGLEVIEKQGPRLAFIDIEMPGMNGQETLKAIRRDPRFADIAIVMMTGVTDDQQKIEAMANGANSYTNKPTDALTFMHTVMQSTNYWLRIHQFPSTAAQSNVA